MKRFLYIFAVYTFLCTIPIGAQVSSLPTDHRTLIHPHTGQMQYDLTLYRLADPDFDWHIHMTYATDAFRPFTYSGTVGDNWSLQIAGSITREVLDVADDTDSTDRQSDIYSFAFPGYSGDFLIDEQGRAVIISGDYVEIDLSEMTYQTGEGRQLTIEKKSFNLPLNSVITITTIDGYRYVFGGSISALGYQYFFDRNFYEPNITQWHLTKVIAPNRRELRFHYRPMATEGLANRLQIHLQPYVNTGYISIPYSSDTLHSFPHISNECSNMCLCVGQYAIDNICLLDSITTSDGAFRILIQYADRSNRIYPKEHSGSNLSTKELESVYRSLKPFVTRIQVHNDSIRIAQWDFAYCPLDIDSLSRQYLVRLTHHSGILYTFDYNLSELATIHSITKIDSYDYAGYYIPNPIFGSIRTIENPLGGRTNFEYTLCQYDSIRIPVCNKDNTLHSEVRPKDFSAKRALHAIVVSAIEEQDLDGSTLSYKRYSYGIPGMEISHYEHKREIPTNSTNDYNHAIDLSPSFVSSGVLNIDYAIDASAIREKKYLLCPYLSFHGRNVPYVEYNRVQEIVYKSDQRSVLYSTIFFYDKTFDNWKVELSSGTSYLPELLSAYRCFSQYQQRQRWVEQQIVRAGEVRRLTKRQYSPFYTPRNTSTIVYPSEPPANSLFYRIGDSSYRVFCDRTYLQSQTLIEYEEEGSYQTITTFERDSCMRLSYQTIQKGTDPRIAFRRYVYPDQITTSTADDMNAYAGAYYGLVQRHRIATPVEEQQGFLRNDTAYLTGASLQIYCTYNLPSTAVESSEIGHTQQMPSIYSPTQLPPIYPAPYATLALQTDKPIPMGEYTPLHIDNGQLSFDSRCDTIATYTYDEYLRLVKYTPISSPTTIYEWDNRHLFITATQQGNFTTRYTHIPYIGVSSETSPRGITTYYNYDQVGNIVYIYQIINGKKIIIQANKYHYATQSIF